MGNKKPSHCEVGVQRNLSMKLYFNSFSYHRVSSILTIPAVDSVSWTLCNSSFRPY